MSYAEDPQGFDGRFDGGRIRIHEVKAVYSPVDLFSMMVFVFSTIRSFPGCAKPLNSPRLPAFDEADEDKATV